MRMSGSQQATVTAIPVSRRTELREDACGDVWVIFPDTGVEFPGRLLDRSPQGFRMLHDCHTLGRSQTIEFRHPWAAGKARVMWTRLSGGRVETGFYVLEVRGA